MSTEKRLIDANVLSGKVEESKHNNPHPKGMLRVGHRNEHDHFLRMILDAPTVDAVEVVRCKDCKSCKMCYPEKQIDKEATPGWYCKKHKAYRSPDDYCSFGERKGND